MNFAPKMIIHAPLVVIFSILKPHQVGCIRFTSRKLSALDEFLASPPHIRPSN